jgi:hypothetical protein
MGGAVVLEAETLSWIVEVRPTEEAASFVVQRNLGLRPRQPGQDEQQAEARLHGRLGRGLGELHRLAELRDALARRVGRHPLLQVYQPHQATVQRHVNGHHRFDER